ncbi:MULTISPECIES: outer membrane protein [Methylobacterium]|uniref:Adhesin RP828 n=1 Tax=Methylobacterium thuringiense TaxID=1003091 RepID=A0ABQ4TIS1_9HYPH|nr:MULTISPECIES: outer membrane beta-barrel protein [Methylobacterium]TXN20013.1 porin family protein [Methylobacterium sp. WL9]GJE55171.1 Putative adhesin RP828 [Methylobacterium thuringiense]
MGRSKLHALARSLTLLASVGAPCLAHAADLLPPPPPPPPIPVDVGGGWYLRGDVGVGATQYEKVRTTLGTGGALPAGYVIENRTIEDQFFAGAGAGYQFNSFLRGDVTGEYRGGGQIRYTEKFPLGGGTGIDVNSAKFRSIVTMANGYIDLGTWWCLTPYIGGGVGAAFNQVSGYTDQGAGFAAGGFGTAPTKNTTSLAWAAQAGITYDVTPNFKVDVGYRYLNMGNAKTGTVTCVNDPTCSFASYKVSEITSHDVKIGLRFLLGGVAAPMPIAYEPGPLITKY